MTSRANSLHSSNPCSEALNQEREKQRAHEQSTTKKQKNKRRKHSSPTTLNTKVTVSNCFKVILYIILYALTGAYFILWIIACDNQRCFKQKWKLFGHSYAMPYRLVYSIIGTVLHLFIIIICFVFLLKYLIYAHSRQIQEKIRKTVHKSQRTLHKLKKQPKTDMYSFLREQYRKDIEQQSLFKLAQSNPQKSSSNSLLTHFKIVWIIGTELLLSLFYIECTEFNVVAMASLCYYMFGAVLYFNISDSVQRDDIVCSDHSYNIIRSDQMFFGFGAVIKAFALILPGICINICQKWKCVYSEYYDVPEMSVTFKGSKFENSTEDSAHEFVLNNCIDNKVSKAENLTFIELRSVLNDLYLRTWIFLLFSVESVIFVVTPIANNDDYRDMLNDQYRCHCNVDNCSVMECKPNSLTFFTINELILRLFVPITLVSTLVLVISFEKKFQISRMDALRYVISPSTVSVIVLITLCELYWWDTNKDGIVTIWSIVYGVTAIAQLYIFVALLDIQDNAYRNRDRLYGFKKSAPLSYYLEGVIAIGVMIICLVSFVLENKINNGHLDKTYIIVRGSGILLFDLIELIMLIPIRTIAISPKYRNHFKKKGKKKYLRTFRWICFLNICNIIYSIIFICDEFSNLLMDSYVLHTATMRSAFTLSFGSVYFNIWGLSQLLPWIIPSDAETSTLYTFNPGIDQKSEISYLTQYHKVDNSRLCNTGINSSVISPPPSGLMSDLDIASSLRYKLSKRAEANGDLSSLKIIESPPSYPKNSRNTKHKQRPMLKERKINMSFDETDGDSNLYIAEKYEDVIKLFKPNEEQSMDNDNVNQLDNGLNDT